MEEGKKAYIKCSNEECGKMIEIPVYCDDEQLLIEYLQEGNTLPCPYCDTVNSCHMQSMRVMDFSDIEDL